ncbi:MAG: proton-conducting transporter membrane subunit [bacterium]
MNEWLIILGIAFHALSGVTGLFGASHDGRGQRVSVAIALIGSLCGITGAIWAWVCPPVSGAIMRIDGLSVFFLIPIFLIPALGGIYGMEYWPQAKHPRNGRKLRLFYGLVTAAMAGVAVAANAILFLTAWEIMALSAFFLVTTEDEDRAVREAGWVYLVTTHLSTLCLFAMFVLMRAVTGSFALGPIMPGAASTGVMTVLFVLAVIAFGCKAGVMPLHIWLPSAHAMTPSHVSALMSGVMIKVGIYGLLRMTSWLPDPPVWWGGVLLGLGAVSGVVGVVLALGQHDLKRLLAYHSIENIGIIVMGIGLALVGRSLNCMDWVLLGLAGGLLHVWNHGLFKSLLFLSAGSVIHAAQSRDMDHLGGLARVMPWTALFFAVGAVAICGLPPLNGFVSELLIYLGAFRALGIGGPVSWAGAAFVVPVLALIGALAVACFVKAFGAVFLGLARSPHGAHAHEVGWGMRGSMGVLAVGCVVIGVAPGLVAPVLERAVAAWGPGMEMPVLTSLIPLGWISVGAGALVLMLSAGMAVLVWFVRRGTVTSGITWDCGYAAPSARMQYTASSLAGMLGGLFAWIQQPRAHQPALTAVFPARTRFRSHVLDLVLDAALKPAFRFVARFLSSFRFLQAGNIHVYLLYIVVFLMVLLLWR